MLERARDLAERGRGVYVVVHPDHREAICDALFDEIRSGSVHVEVFVGLPNLDLRTLTLRGAHPNCIVLVDHYAIEERFGALLEEVHRYDASPEADRILAECEDDTPDDDPSVEHHPSDEEPF